MEFKPGSPRGDALLEFPLSVVQRTHIPRLEPPRNAVEVESMLQDTVDNLNHRFTKLTKVRTLQMPQAAVHSSLVAETWFA